MLTLRLQAIGVQPGEKGGLTVTTKNATRWNKPAQTLLSSEIAGKTSTRK
jgi:hypothetical protein